MQKLLLVSIKLGILYRLSKPSFFYSYATIFQQNLQCMNESLLVPKENIYIKVEVFSEDHKNFKKTHPLSFEVTKYLMSNPRGR